MEKLEFVDLFQEKKIDKISNNSFKNKNVIKAGSIKTVSMEETENLSNSKNVSEIQLKKRDEKVEVIIVTCSCGRETHIALEYDNAKINKKPQKKD